MVVQYCQTARGGNWILEWKGRGIYPYSTSTIYEYVWRSSERGNNDAIINRASPQHRTIRSIGSVRRAVVGVSQIRRFRNIEATGEIIWCASVPTALARSVTKTNAGPHVAMTTSF